MQTAALYNDFGMLAGLRADARENSQAALSEVAGQFEALFVQMMLKSMREATPKGGLFDSNQLENYEQMYDQQLAMELAAQGGIGLSEVIMSQFQGATVANDETPSAGFNALPNYRVPSMRSQAPAVAAQEQALDWDASSPEEFVRSLTPQAHRAAAELGVDADVLVAQAALETGWGRHVIAANGAPSNNMFNIKAGGDWSGPVVRQQTLEYRDGVAVRESAEFRAYASAQEAFDDYVAFVKESPRYQQALAKAADGEQYLRELQRAGYATDPAYADKVMAVRDRIVNGVEELALKSSHRQSLTD